jgi:hypothetical protein
VRGERREGGRENTSPEVRREGGRENTSPEVETHPLIQRYPPRPRAWLAPRGEGRLEGGGEGCAGGSKKALRLPHG